MKIISSDKRYQFPILVILLHTAGLILRWFWIIKGRFPFNSDEAIVGLMGRHILTGEIPTFFYGQSYMGSLDAIWSAVFFHLFGSTIISLRISQTILWIGLVISVFSLSREIFRSSRAAWISTFLLAIPPVNLLLYSTVSLGGYLEALIIGVWTIIFAHQIHRMQGTQYIRIFADGLLSGFGVWVFGFSLIFTIPACILTLWVIVKRFQKTKHLWIGIALLIVGISVGALPWWIYAIKNGFVNLLTELGGSAIAVEQGSFFAKALTHLFSFTFIGIPAALGLRPPWTVEWLVLPLIPLILIGWFFFLLQGRTQPNRTGRLLLYAPLIILFVVFILTPFGVDPSGRYFLPFNILLPVLAGGIFIYLDQKKKSFFIVWITLVLIFQIAGNIQAEKNSKSGITTQFAPGTEIDHTLLPEVQNFLTMHGETRGYTTYWLSYPLAFNSDEELIFTPRLPYHRDFRYTDRDDRYDPYREAVLQSDKLALVTYDFQKLDQSIRRILTDKAISWDEQSIGKYLIFYNLSTRLEEGDLLFPVEVNP